MSPLPTIYRPARGLSVCPMKLEHVALTAVIAAVVFVVMQKTGIASKV